jgi:hypothetical protein
MVSMGASVICLTWIRFDDSVAVGNVYLPTLFAGVLAYAVVSMFLSVFEVGVDSILLCILVDERVNEASGNYYCSDEIRKVRAVRREREQPRRARAARAKRESP